VQRWLAAVIIDYRPYFAQNRVAIVFCTGAPQAEKALPLTSGSMSEEIESLGVSMLRDPVSLFRTVLDSPLYAVFDERGFFLSAVDSLHVPRTPESNTV
jgi:hypothetical protein